MAYHVDIDDEQEFKFVQPIFDALIKNNAPDDLIKKVFIDTNIPRYLQYLPPSIQNDPTFLKECLDKQIISLNQLPPQFITQDFVSKELYLKNISAFWNGLNTNIYPQDEDIVYVVLKNEESAYWNINEEFKNDSKLMTKCFISNPELYRFLKSEIQEEFLKDKKSLIHLLKQEPSFYDYIQDPIRTDEEVIKAVLHTIKGYNLVKDDIRKSRDPEIALLALSHTDSARNNINQMYSSILKQNKINTNCHNFLKIYLAQNQLKNELEEKDNNKNNGSMKI